MRQCEFKRKYNPSNGKHEKTYIYGEGIFDFLGSQLFSGAAKKIAKDVSKKAVSAALNKTGNYVGNRAGEKIISLLQKTSPSKSKSESKIKSESQLSKPQLSDYEINERVQRLLSGSGKKK